jgi:hypothetical protein
MANGAERRKEPRITCKAPATVEGPRGIHRGTCLNISPGGMFFSGSILPMGTNVSVTVDVGGPLKIEAQGEVRHHQRDAEGAAMGIRFTRITQEHLALLNAFLSKLTASPG